MKTKTRVWFYLDGQRVSRVVDTEHWLEPNNAVWEQLGKPTTPFIYHYEEVTQSSHKSLSGRMSVKAQYKPELGTVATLQVRGQS